MEPVLLLFSKSFATQARNCAILSMCVRLFVSVCADISVSVNQCLRVFVRGNHVGDGALPKHGETAVHALHAIRDHSMSV